MITWKAMLEKIHKIAIIYPGANSLHWLTKFTLRKKFASCLTYYGKEEKK